MASNGSWKDWETAWERNGSKVEVRKNTETGIVQTRASTVVPCPTDQLWELLVTPESYMKLMPKTRESRYLDEKPKQKQVHCYQRVSGGPVSDRDYTLLVKWTVGESKLGKKYVREWSVDNEKGPPPSKGAVRVEVNNGSWTLTPVAGKKTAFEQITYVELGGSLWTLVANTAIKDAAQELLENLKAKYPD